MKRSFSLEDLVGNAADQHSDSSTVERAEASSPASGEIPLPVRLGTMQRSKSMNALDHCESQGEEPSRRLPSILSLGLSSQIFNQVHGLEVLKRSARETGSGSGNGMTSLPRSLSNSSLSQLNLQDDDIGAATALMELCGSAKKTVPAASASHTRREEQAFSCEMSTSEQNNSVVALPSLRELLGGEPPGIVHATSPRDTQARINQANMYGQPQTNFGDEGTLDAMKGYRDFAAAARRAGAGDTATHATAARAAMPEVCNSTPSGGALGYGEAESPDGKHNKYCHFCQHVKVKRATSMLACENAECARRFCEHCLKTHLSNVVPSDGKGISEQVDGKWLCPICRKVCCCAIQSCEKQHRHCKAYRYRQRRAQQAAKRSIANESTRGRPAAAPAATMHVSQVQHWAHPYSMHSAFPVMQMAAAQAHFADMGKWQSLQAMQLQHQGVLSHGDFGQVSQSSSVPGGTEGQQTGQNFAARAAGAQGLGALSMGVGPPFTRL
jgi:hypothetical protein